MRMRVRSRALDALGMVAFTVVAVAVVVLFVLGVDDPWIGAGE